MEITTVAEDMVVLHRRRPGADAQGAPDAPGATHVDVHRVEGLAPGTDHTVHGVEVRTLDRPGGELLTRFATVNDVHFGEQECGRIDDNPQGPIQRSAPGEPPYPETMNRAAIAEIAAIDPAAVIAKGDLTDRGRPHEFAAFAGHYGAAFGDRLVAVRGNHDGYEGQDEYAGDRWVELPGVAIALIDTVTPGTTPGTIRPETIEWLDTNAAESDRPVIVMGHHQQWIDGEDNSHRSEGYFGIHPDASEALSEVVARRASIIAYTSGHTHRHRVRHMPCGVPSIEIGCVKDFPGTWAEYRVYEGGVVQVVHRISSPEALSWSERCRVLYRDFGVDYETYAMGRLEDRCRTIQFR